MPDVMDAVQQRVQDDLDKALKAQAAKVAIIGRADCIECGEYISPVRQNLGAQLCLDCQRAQEADEQRRQKRGVA